MKHKILGFWLALSFIVACSTKPPPPPPPPVPPPQNPLPKLPQPDQIEHVNPDEDPSVLPKAASDS